MNSENQLTVVTTFCGTGGSSAGYTMANCKVLLAIDFEKKAIESYKMNFPNTIAWHKNIREVTGQMILDAINMKPGELDIFDGSPPCTPFSTTGKREKGWGIAYKHASETTAQRADDLFYEQIRLIKELQPKVFVCENVQGMIVGKAKGYFNEILKAMHQLNYSVKVFKVNAKHFEVPQSRPRLIFIGIRKDIEIPQLMPTFPKYPIITCGEALRGVVNSDEELRIAYAKAQRSIPLKWLKFAKPGVMFNELTPRRTLWNYGRISFTKPAPTISAGGVGQFYHPLEDRSLTISELKRLFTFPDDFKFLDFDDAWRRMGNSVPPKLIMHVAKYVQKILNVT